MTRLKLACLAPTSALPFPTAAPPAGAVLTRSNIDQVGHGRWDPPRRSARPGWQFLQGRTGVVK